MESASAIRKVAFLGDYLPRKCGIATFTTDLRCAVAAEFPAMQCLVVPVNDLAAGYDYPAEVRFEIAEQDLPSYLRAADFLNITDVDVVCVEHEFGIFGGPAGSHVLALLRELRMPIVTTLAHGSARPKHGTAARDARTDPAFDPAGGHDRTRSGVAARSLSCADGED